MDMNSENLGLKASSDVFLSWLSCLQSSDVVRMSSAVQTQRLHFIRCEASLEWTRSEEVPK